MDLKKRSPSKTRKRDRSATEAALLKSAQELFSQQGFDATTTKAIADRAKVNEQLIQRYFRGKDGLLIAVMKSFRSQVMDQDDFGMVQGADLQEELQKILGQAPEFFAQQGDLMRIGFSQALLNPRVGDVVHRKLNDQLIPDRMKRMAAYQSKGWLDPELDLWSVTYGLMLLIFGIGFTGQFVHRMKREKLKLVAREMAKIIARGLAPK